MLHLTCPRCLFGTTTSTAEPDPLLPHTSKRNRIRMQLHVVPQPANFITRAISGFSIPMNVVIFQLIKIFLSQGVAYHRVSQTSETPLSKNPSFPCPRCCTVQYSISAQICVGLLHACMHTCITHIHTPVPPPRIPRFPSELNRGNVAPSPPCCLHYLTVHLYQPLPSIHYLSINAQPQPQLTQIPFFPDPSFIQYSLTLAATGCPMACIPCDWAALDAERRLPPFCRVRQGQGSSARRKEWE
ncbi:hypothetical protein F5882DRAFT_164704 [Hyaloscypha sp. PMI_1271]|nr:hypothetical protein F5882DRAFT_164704 [Hyaloscypha sp. PMI_1271]